MRRLGYTLCALVFMIHAANSCAGAAPMTMQIDGAALNVPVHSTTDVTSGYSGATTPLISGEPLALLPGFVAPAPGGSANFPSTIALTAELSGIDGDPTQHATVTLTGPINGTFTSDPLTGNITGNLLGTAVAGTPILGPGVDTASLPAWFTGLSVQVSGSVAGGGENLLSAQLTVFSGPSVPEPATIAVFGVLLGGLVLGRRRFPARFGV